MHSVSLACSVWKDSSRWVRLLICTPAVPLQTRTAFFSFFFFAYPTPPPPPQLFVLLFFLSFFTFIFIVILYFTVWDVEPLVTHRHLGLESQVYPCHALRKHSVSTRSALTWHLVGTHG